MSVSEKNPYTAKKLSFKLPDYTKNPHEYLTSSENLSVKLAKATNSIVKQFSVDYDYLKELSSLFYSQHLEPIYKSQHNIFSGLASNEVNTHNINSCESQFLRKQSPPPAFPVLSPELQARVDLNEITPIFAQKLNNTDPDTKKIDFYSEGRPRQISSLSYQYIYSQQQAVHSLPSPPISNNSSRRCSDSSKFTSISITEARVQEVYMKEDELSFNINSVKARKNIEITYSDMESKTSPEENKGTFKDDKADKQFLRTSKPSKLDNSKCQPLKNNADKYISPEQIESKPNISILKISIDSQQLDMNLEEQKAFSKNRPKPSNSYHFLSTHSKTEINKEKLKLETYKNNTKNIVIDHQQEHEAIKNMVHTLPLIKSEYESMPFYFSEYYTNHDNTITTTIEYYISDMPEVVLGMSIEKDPQSSGESLYNFSVSSKSFGSITINKRITEYHYSYIKLVQPEDTKDKVKFEKKDDSHSNESKPGKNQRHALLNKPKETNNPLNKDEPILEDSKEMTKEEAETQKRLKAQLEELKRKMKIHFQQEKQKLDQKRIADLDRKLEKQVFEALPGKSCNSVAPIPDKHFQLYSKEQQKPFIDATTCNFDENQKESKRSLIQFMVDCIESFLNLYYPIYLEQTEEKQDIQKLKDNQEKPKTNTSENKPSDNEETSKYKYSKPKLTQLEPLKLGLKLPSLSFKQKCQTNYKAIVLPVVFPSMPKNVQFNPDDLLAKLFGRDIVKRMQQELDFRRIRVLVSSVVEESTSTLLENNYILSDLEKKPNSPAIISFFLGNYKTFGSFFDVNGQFSSFSSKGFVEFEQDKNQQERRRFSDTISKPRLMTIDWSQFDNDLELLPQNRYDVDVDWNTDLLYPKDEKFTESQAYNSIRRTLVKGSKFSKLVCGRFCAEIFRLCIIELYTNDLIFTSAESKRALANDKQFRLFSPWSLSMDLLIILVEEGFQQEDENATSEGNTTKSKNAKFKGSFQQIYKNLGVKALPCELECLFKIALAICVRALKLASVPLVTLVLFSRALDKFDKVYVILNGSDGNETDYCEDSPLVNILTQCPLFEELFREILAKTQLGEEGAKQLEFIKESTLIKSDKAEKFNYNGSLGAVLSAKLSHL